MSKRHVTDLSAKLDAMQNLLNEVREASGGDSYGPTQINTDTRLKEALEIARRSYNNRRSRCNFFDSKNLFGEPAWDILLDLFIRQASSERVLVKSACIGAAAPATTALRWLNVLEEQGLLSIAIDPEDRRSKLVSLTPRGFESMLRYLHTVAA